MRVLKEGIKGPDVKRWQNFLLGQGFDPGLCDGQFNERTRDATIAFQSRFGLTADGIVGNATWGQAMVLGLPVLEDLPTGDQTGPDFPPKPDFPPLTSTAERQALFGRFKFEADPIPGNRENIRILGDWEAQNIVRVQIPQLAGISGAPSSGAVRFHRLAVAQLVSLWKAWEDAGLLSRVKTWGGSFVPRFIRGSDTVLSNHAFGTAFDINVAFNPLGAQPALVGRPGSVRELAPIANQHGFYWGGHFTRLDGMHFEVAKLKG
jgi:D-alanyl-D-alanine carboxypeptidase-like protein/putative peptidoglycan binding protein